MTDFREAFAAVEKVIREIQERKDKLVREALLETCCVKGCEAKVRTAKWVVEMATNPMVERLVLRCDVGHEWYRKISTEIGPKQVVLRSLQFPAPFEPELFREIEASVEAAMLDSRRDAPATASEVRALARKAEDLLTEKATYVSECRAGVHSGITNRVIRIMDYEEKLERALWELFECARRLEEENSSQVVLEKLFSSVNPKIGGDGHVVSGPEPWLVHGEPWLPVGAEIVPTSFNAESKAEELDVKFRLRRLHSLMSQTSMRPDWALVSSEPEDKP